ncbi:HEAT repeat domain-containing protein [Nodosilinea nodulosa]|uniref:HEAT repeat domain-containing protein n=1 Tax=Nodosilinea nodulosa TaxID=416001 RepID=UPI0002F4BE5E|nr:HEAT repeat domain-containing protein [Nodosilinea nodulosa]
MDRAQLFDDLSNLSSHDFERLILSVNMPRMNRAGASAKIGEQVSALLDWADSAIGPGLEAIARHLAELNRFEFDACLRSLIATYEKWWEHYTITDAVGKVDQAQPEQPSVFDFGLMVQTVTKEREPADPENNPLQKEKEKTERLPVLDGIRKYADGHVLLVGRPGSGKSTALIRLVLEVATETLKEGQGQIPILVELRYWQTSVIERIQAFLHQHDPALSLDNAALTTLLRQGRFLLLVDGLNELPSDEARTQLTTFRRDHPKVPMIFTTRDLGLGGDLGIEKKLEMQPLTEAQMKAFIRAYVPDQAEAMLRQLSVGRASGNQTRLREFGQTPLLLWMLCEVFQRSSNRQLPTNLAEVFRAFTTMYEDSSVRKHEVALLKGDVRPLSDRRLWKDALKALAALMMQGETPVDFRVAIHRTEAERELSKIFANEKFPARDILDDLLKYHLLQNRTTDQLEFRHQLIQEYYAAEHLLCLLPDLLKEKNKFKRDYLNYLKWTEAIALMLGLVKEDAQSLQVVKLAIDDVDLMLGARLAGDVIPPLQSTAIGWISTSDVPTRLKIQYWTMSHSEAAIPSLLKALENSDSDVRMSAAEALGQIGSEAAIPSLLKAIENSDSDVRWSVAEALGKIGSEAAIPSLLKALEDQDPNVRVSAAEALGKIGSEVAILGLLKALGEQNLYHQGVVAEALVKIDSKVVIPDLLKALENQDSNVRGSAAEALGQIGSEAAIPGLLKALEDREFYVRGSAAEALGKIGSEKAIPSLIKALKAQNFYAAEALGKIGSEKAIPSLIKTLENQYFDVRRRSAETLGKIGSEKAIPGLLKALEDREFDVRRSAAAALGKIGSEAAIPSLLKALKNSDSDVRRRSADALGEIGSEAAIPSLLKAIEDQVSSVRGRSATALGKIGSEAAIPSLLKALKNLDSDVRGRSADALGEIGSEAAIPSLLKALEDQDFSVRWRSATALGKIGSEAAIPSLLKALEDQDFIVRMSAAEVFEEIGTPNCLTKLWQLHLQQPEDALKRAISAIQDRCKFYNYEIWQACLTGQQADSTPSQSDKIIANTITVQTVEKLTIMSDKAPIFNQQNATIGVNYAAEGSQQDFTQHIHVPEQNFETLLTGYKHFIDELQQQNPHVTDETAITQTIDIEARRIDTRWQNFLNLKRLWNGGKKAAIKVGEHFVESNPWGKGAIAFLEGVSEDVK